MKTPITMPSFNAVAAGQTATLDLPATGTYHSLIIHFVNNAVDAVQATMEALLTGIRIKVNGKVQRVFSAQQLFDINADHGMTVTAGYLEIFFAEPWRRTTQGEDALGWGMGDVDTFQMEIDIGAAAVNPVLSVKAVKTQENRPMGPITKWKRFSMSPGAAGTFNVMTLPKNDPYYALHFWHANITAAEVKVDETEKWNLTVAEAAIFAAQYGRVAQAGVLSIDFDVTNRVSDMLLMTRPDGSGARINDFRIDLSMSAADNITLVTETVGLRD